MFPAMAPTNLIRLLHLFPNMNSNHMWFFTAPNTNKLFHAGPSKTAHWIDVTGSGSVSKVTVKRSVDQMCGNAVMYVTYRVTTTSTSASCGSSFCSRNCC
jgi:galactose oxidase